MPQIRYFHRGRFHRPTKPLHFLPPLKLTTGAVHQPLTTDGRACKKASPGPARGHHRGKQSRYRKMVTTLAGYLTLANLADMKFLCRDHVRPPQIVDDVTSAKHLFALLENQHLLAENSLYFLQTLLYYIARPDLYQVVLDFRADRQDELVERGVGVDDKYQVTQDSDAERLELAHELLKFRKDLKPRQRLNRVDVGAMKRRLEALSVRMQENLGGAQRAGAQDGAHDGAQAAGRRGEPVTADSPSEAEPAAAEPTKSVRGDSQARVGSAHELLRTPPRKGRGRAIKPDPPKRVEDTVPEEAPSVAPSPPSTTERSEEEEEEEEEEVDNDQFAEDCPEGFGWETPCPPPRESTLAGRHAATRAGRDADRSADEPSPAADRVARKIRRLRRLSKDQRPGVRGRHGQQGATKRKKRAAKARPAASSTEDGQVPSRADRGSGRDELKLPDIYDKYARQTAVQYYT